MFLRYERTRGQIMPPFCYGLAYRADYKAVDIFYLLPGLVCKPKPIESVTLSMAEKMLSAKFSNKLKPSIKRNGAGINPPHYVIKPLYSML